MTIYYLADLGQAASSVPESTPLKHTERNETYPQAEEVYTLAPAQDAVPEYQRSSLTTCNTKISTNQTHRPSTHTTHLLATVPLGIVDEKRPLLLVHNETPLRPVSEPYDIKGLTESARAAT